ncbi:hypothetical protein TREES_T100003434 [Tupaia chinensis]|uniref:Uncharacterized protein n=1 Tax=Tupaia chinensis TaxID=246437 RepID=L9JBI8_TUPCH|nr:hypothetical protein TREES_T100003434 [Tupaia chinensis]
MPLLTRTPTFHSWAPGTPLPLEDKPPSLGPACSAHPALHAPPTAASGRHSGAASEQQLRAQAPAPGSPAGGRQKLRRRRRPRGQVRIRGHGINTVPADNPSTEHMDDDVSAST